MRAKEAASESELVFQQPPQSERQGVRPFVSPKMANEQNTPGYNKSDFKYDKEEDIYICPSGAVMRTNGRFYKKSDRGQYKFKRYSSRACQSCPIKQLCTQRDQGRLIERPAHQEFIDRNDNRVRRYLWYYKKRQEIIEHVFEERAIQ